MKSPSEPQSMPALSRRRFLQKSAVAAAAAWVPIYKVTPAHAEACNPPPNFPSHIEVYQQAFENWSKGIVIDALWTCAPGSAQECVDRSSANEAGILLTNKMKRRQPLR